MESGLGLLDNRLSHFRELIHGPGPAQPFLTHASVGPCHLGWDQASWKWDGPINLGLFNEVLDFLDIGPKPLEHS